jgi:hypothetical protein
VQADSAKDLSATDASAYVGEAHRIDRADDEYWHDEADVVGFSGAGACAALEARAQGADVLVLERFEGGGATALSSGVYYGGATRHLRAAGFNHTPDAMFRYLKLEVGDVYLGKLGYHIAELEGDRVWVVVDRELYLSSFAEVLPKRGDSWLSFGAPLAINLIFNMKKASSLRALAERCGIDGIGWEATVARYNTEAAAARDALNKTSSYLHPLGTGPYYALDISISNKRFPCPTIPMGGLVVDDNSGAVLRGDGTAILGLYAAGRVAKGIPSGFYISGTAIADCVFSGRRAGLHAALGQHSSQNPPGRLTNDPVQPACP